MNQHLRSNAVKVRNMCKEWRTTPLNKLTGTIKYGGESVMIWGCLNNEQVGNLVIIQGKLTSAKYVDCPGTIYSLVSINLNKIHVSTG